MSNRQSIHPTRRSLLLSSWSLLLTPSVARAAGASVIQGGPSAATSSSAPVGRGFPVQDPDLVREMVAVAHGQVARVRELVGKRPTLAKAAYDWGFGDWESALGAASHVGNREIAEFLLANGARPTIFSAAMLGQLDVVKAFIGASPGVQRIKGPHSITLLRHAMAGGPQAKPVLEYLQQVGGADERLTEVPLTPEERDKLCGPYVFGANADDRLEVSVARDLLQVARPGQSPRVIIHLGSLEFYPVGAEAVRLRFGGSAAAMTLTVHDPDVVVTAIRRA
jgi:hypothetical protein